MKKSRYFSDLIKNYNDEIDDLVTDSEGKSVLQKRLNEKRREIDAILPMIEFSPEMVSVVFYGAFGFKSPEIMQRVVLSEPGDAGFLAWRELESDLTVFSLGEAADRIVAESSRGRRLSRRDCRAGISAQQGFVRCAGAEQKPRPRKKRMTKKTMKTARTI